MKLPLSRQILPQGSCPSTYDQLLELFRANLFVDLDESNSQLIVSATKPSDTTKAWLRLDSSGRPDRIYWFAQGAWLSLHATPPGLTQWWFRTLPDFTSFDGGDSNPLSALSGPMWQKATTSDGTVIAAKFPIVEGTLPSGQVLGVGDTGGAEQHTNTLAEMVPHTHDIKFIEFSDGRQPGIDRGLIETETNPDGTAHTESTGGTGTPAAPTPFSIMPPYCVGFLLQRTNRLFYSIV